MEITKYYYYKAIKPLATSIDNALLSSEEMPEIPDDTTDNDTEDNSQETQGTGKTTTKTIKVEEEIAFETEEVEEKNMLKENFNFDIPICIIEASHLKDIMEHIPTWQQEENKDRYNNIIFTIPPTTIEDACTKVGEPTENIDIIEPYKDIIYWSFDSKNYRKSSW